MRRVAFAAVLLLLAGCAAHEKAGDRAGAVGDWKTAEREYARALQSDPDQKDLQAKYQEARTHALAESRRAAQACAVGQDWECALSESQYALGLDPGDATMAALRRDAGREAGRQRLSHAREALARGESARAMELIEAARTATQDPAVEAAARSLVPSAVAAAAHEADRYRAARQYPQAIDLLSRATRLDPGVGPHLEAVKAEYESFKDAEAERLAQEGDRFLAARQLSEARARYDEAVAIRPMSRARELSRYTSLLQEGDAAVARRDFGGAERAYRTALDSGLDRGFARDGLDRVVVHRFAVRLRTVRVRGGGPPGDLFVTVSLPDGRRLLTPPQRGNFARLEASFVVAANSYDERVVSAHVFRRVAHAADPPFDLGSGSFRLADLLARRSLALRDGVVDELTIDALPTTMAEGSIMGFELFSAAAAPPSAPPRPVK
ncbi:MAG TPA: hypothetical protein VMG32_06305 [Anaeromyxobacteraceae bacterium]|nr:hypothetical protein [Anaeromyxobacteraceae bacterium]